MDVSEEEINKIVFCVFIMRKDAMKILLINLWQIIDAKGGTEKVFCNMANAMVERNHKVTAVCLENRGENLFLL